MLLSKTQSQPHQEAREAIKVKYPTQWRPVSIRTPDGILLDGGEFQHLRMYDASPKEQRWIIWLNANGMSWEDSTTFSIGYASLVGVNLLLFNYRGVGNSQGQTTCAADLIRDGQAAMHHLLDKGVDAKYILIHGHSLGGGVGAHIRAQYPEGPLIHDRSFSSLSAVVKDIFRGLFGACVAAAIGIVPVLVHALMGIAGGVWPSMLSSWWRVIFNLTSIIFGGTLSYVLGLLSYQYGIKLHDDRSNHMKIALATGLSSGGIVPVITMFLFDAHGWIGSIIGVTELLIMIATLGFGLGGIGFLAPLAGLVVRLLQWDLNAVSSWQRVRGPKAIIYHQRDGMIPYKTASLHQAVGTGCNIYEHSFGDGSDKNLLAILNGGGTGPITHLDIELMEDDEKLINCHMCPLNSTTAWHYIIPMVRVFLDLPIDAQDLPEMEIPDMDEY